MIWIEDAARIIIQRRWGHNQKNAPRRWSWKRSRSIKPSYQLDQAHRPSLFHFRTHRPHVAHQVHFLLILSNAIEHMKGPGSGSIFSSFIDGGGLILGMFLFYVIAFGVAWYCGYQKRDQMRREAVEKQIARERANNALNNIEWSVRIYVLLLIPFINY